MNHEQGPKEESVQGEYKQMKLGRIREGTVIDHVPPELCFKLIKILCLEDYGNVISAATNLNSKKLGKKAMIKISMKFLSEDEVNKILIVAPNVTLCIIREFNVEKKIKLSLPDEVRAIIKCKNPNCITNLEEVKTRFKVVEQDPLKIKCHFCERAFGKEEIKLK